MTNAKPQRTSISKENFLELSETVNGQKNSKPEPDDVPMTTYVCKGCERKLFDTNLYFYGTKSEKCLWCSKFPKVKKK